ncbi:MAG: 50S ribosomal protein L18 [Thiotrichales bacterium]|nr:50S ribosomal protein L18 [Thiotrichales bacterium]
MNKKQARLRRAKKTRARIKRQSANRLCVFRTPRHVYAQIITPDSANVLASASTVEKEVKSRVKGTGNIEAATMVGKILAERARAAGVSSVAFDRSGFKYHGRIKALAESARENGIEF